MRRSGELDSKQDLVLETTSRAQNIMSELIIMFMYFYEGTFLLCLINYHDMKTYRGVKVQLHHS
jgi:hypothetical protein